MAELQPLEHLGLFLQARITDAQTNQETIKLCLRQRKRALMIDGILRRNDQKRWLKNVSLPIDGDAALGHRFEQRGLGARRGPVDFIREDRLGKDRAGTELEFRRLLIEH